MRSVNFEDRVDACMDQFGAAEQSWYIEIFEELPRRSDLQASVESLMDKYLLHGYDAAEGYTAALRGLFRAGSVKQAVEIFGRAQAGDHRGFVELPLDLVCSLQTVLGRYGQWKPALAHIRTCRQQGMSPTDGIACYNALIAGILEDLSPPSIDLVSSVIMTMTDNDVVPDEGTLKLLLRALIDMRSPTFFEDMGRWLVTFARQYQVKVGSETMLLVSEAHMRRGDTDAAYMWYLNSQVCEPRVRLDESQGEYMSQFVRVLARSGQAKRLLRVLHTIRADGGRLPQSANSVVISGHAVGRTLATVWLEPCAEFLRRRGTWANDDQLNIACAEQFQWEQLDARRHENFQWKPYLAPDTKLERAWLSPLRADDAGSLGLERDWSGETPMACAARERLGEGATTAEFMKQRLRLALRLEDPGNRAGYGNGACVPPRARSWRVYHAEEVTGAFSTVVNATPLSKQNLKRKLTSYVQEGTREGSRAAGAPEPQILYTEVAEAVRSAHEDTKKAVLKLFDNEGLDLKEKSPEILCELGLPSQRVNNMTLKDTTRLHEFAVELIKNPKIAVPLSVRQFREWLENMSDEELEQLWQARTGAVSPIMTADVHNAAINRAASEFDEDAMVEGSASDELHIAADVVEALQCVGINPSSADLHALLGAAYAAGNQEAAARLLQVLAEPLKADALSAAAVPEDGGESTGQEALVDTMVRGGWERTSVEQFLVGQVPVPRRDPSTKLGQFLTRYMDPLMGLGKNRAGFFHTLAFGQNQKPNIDVTQITVHAGKAGAETEELIDITADFVVNRICASPPEDLPLFLADLPQDTNSDDCTEVLRRLGLPPIELLAEQKKVMKFVASVARAFMAARDASVEAVDSVAEVA